MADDRIDIEINDKIDAGIPKKLRDIATNADKGENSVKRLKAALASINDTPTRRLKDATDNVTNALNRELNAQKGVSAARTAAASGLSKEAAQRERISAMVDRSIAQMEREAAAKRAAMSVSGPIAQVQGTPSQAAAQTEEMRSATQRLAAARQQDAAAARVQEAATEASTGAINRSAKAAGLARHHMLNLGYQLQDIFVSLQAGQNPMTVFIQQGGQIGQIAGQAGVGLRGMAAAVVALVAPFLPLIAVLGAAFAAFKLFQSDLNDGEPMKKFAEGLGLTRSEMKQLQDVTVTTGDIFKGLWKTISDRTGVDDSLASFKATMIEAFRTTLSKAADVVAGIYAGFVGTYRAIKNTWQNLPALMEGFFIAAANLGILRLESMANQSIEILNKLGKGINAVFGSEIGQISTVHLPRLKAAAGSAAAGVTDEFGKAFDEAKGSMKRFYEDWAKNSTQAAKDRISKQANEIIADRTPTKAKADHTAENRAQALKMVNLELDNELKRMQMLKPEREIQQRMDQIEQQLAQKKITLSQQERSEIEAKVKAISSYAHVQAELDRIYEAAIAPQRTYNATLQAASELLKKGAIDQARYNQEVTLATRTLAEANDPLFALKEQLGQAEAALGKYGVAAQQAAFYEQIRQAYLQKGIELSPQYVAGLNAEVDAIMKRNAALQQQQLIQSTVGEIVDPMLQNQQMLDNKAAYYAELERLRQTDVLSEQQAHRAKYALDAKFSEMRLAGARGFFGELAGLASSGNKKIAAIGKAAAIAQATIDGFVAVQKALASAPPPWNIALAAAIAIKTGMTVANIASTNVGSFATGGQFIVDGRAGVDKNNINMNVSRGERVTVETQAQQRSNDRGGGYNAAPVINLKNVNITDPREALAAMDTAEGEQLFVNIIERKASAIKQILG